MPKVKINGTDIYFEDQGPKDAPAIVFSSLLFLDASAYEPIINLFTDEFRVISYDHRGQGQSGRNTKKSDLTTTTRDAIGLIEYLDIEPCHFVGNCLGAFVGLHIAVQRPALFKSCTLMGAVPEETSSGEMKDMDQYLESLKKHGARLGMQSYVNRVLGSSFRASVDPIMVERREKIIQQFSSVSVDELENVRQLSHRPSISNEELQKISAPVLILAGDEDSPEFLASYRRLGSMIPHVNYKTIPHAGYALAVEQPYEVAQLIRDHIEKAERSFIATKVSHKKTKSAAHKGRH